eukprot:5460429-Amphidinium_carterae.1
MLQVLTVARASRNGIIRQYRKQRQDWHRQTSSTKQQVRRLRTVSRTSLALAEKPSLAVPKKGLPCIDKSRVKEYLAAHSSRLSEEAAAKRKHAKD